MTATILKWLEFTEESAVLINFQDGFMSWTSSRKLAAKKGAFFRTKKNISEIPAKSITANQEIQESKHGHELKAIFWFQYANKEAYVVEYKISSEKYDNILTLVILPRNLNVWKSKGVE
ncbi:toxin-antitoxin system, toxin component [Acinetobacter dispersus]|uniref:toxin-antitoxin system, toxin component n=1 Tax=Acinetobacter dispersus TaxID=70348 RepID=UPI00039C3DDB|nr:toxin-antitoxin system, toxin component [Acinetobacter dispersus]